MLNIANYYKIRVNLKSINRTKKFNERLDAMRTPIAILSHVNIS